jgi:hypothetical protein
VGWDKDGRYYTRSHKVNGRVLREYIGGGRVGRLAAELDKVDRREREAERANRHAAVAALRGLDAPLDELNELVELLARAALEAAGFHQHKRGEWRKKRVKGQRERGLGSDEPSA